MLHDVLTERRICADPLRRVFYWAGRFPSKLTMPQWEVSLCSLTG